ncbi:MAG: LLM class flavin-dependent oxidoreductase, partial [Acetobacteraceae bacterium]
MKFGLFGAATAQRNNNPDVDSAAGFKDYIDYVIEAESLGFESAFIVEHHFTGFGQVSATLNLLTWIGAKTSTLRLGTAVLVLPWHNPVLLAEQAATVDLLSGGRLDFGVGKGYRHNEFASFRIPMEEGQARFEEAIDIITKSWVSNERFDFHGKYWAYDDIIVEPPTIQRPHPPFWQGAGHPDSIRRVAARDRSHERDRAAHPERARWVGEGSNRGFLDRGIEPGRQFGGVPARGRLLDLEGDDGTRRRVARDRHAQRLGHRSSVGGRRDPQRNLHRTRRAEHV